VGVGECSLALTDKGKLGLGLVDVRLRGEGSFEGRAHVSSREGLVQGEGAQGAFR
jgi:hypothetical protein